MFQAMDFSHVLYVELDNDENFIMIIFTLFIMMHDNIIRIIM